ncbi:MAG: CcdB family protein [Rhodopila sp.]|jgi:toxin CcdB
MARFELFRLPADQGYVVDVQSNHASEKVRTRVVVPLVPVAELGKPIADLNPVLRIEGRDYAFIAQSLATLTSAEMGESVGSLTAEHGDRFAYALDILLTGF